MPGATRSRSLPPVLRTTSARLHHPKSRPPDTSILDVPSATEPWAADPLKKPFAQFLTMGLVSRQAQSSQTRTCAMATRLTPNRSPAGLAPGPAAPAAGRLSRKRTGLASPTRRQRGQTWNERVAEWNLYGWPRHLQAVGSSKQPSEAPKKPIGLSVEE